MKFNVTATSYLPALKNRCDFGKSGKICRIRRKNTTK